MDRMACVELSAFPLQLLLQRQPDWREHPAAVVDSDKPQGILLWVNERARGFRILPGMRYAAALSLAGGLRVAEVPRNEIERAVRSLSGGLRDFTPNVEPAADEPGVFWLDATGLERLYPSLSDWAGLVRNGLRRRGFGSTVAVGFTHFGTYVLARDRRGTLVLGSPEDERRAMRRVALERLAFAPATRDALHELGVRTVGDFADLPAEGIGKRFGPEAGRLHSLASGATRPPLQPEHRDPPALERLHLDHPEAGVARLMIGVERLIHPVLQTLADRGQALSRIRVGFRFERLGDHVETLRPAAPTLNVRQLLDLVCLRLEALRKLPDGVTEILVFGEGVPATRKQLRLFADRPRRDLAAADRALARIRAELGEDAVVRARLREGHLPEGRFVWERLEGLAEAQPAAANPARIVRRIFTRPVPLPARPRQEPDGWMLRGLEQGPVVRVLGPYIVSGGWWRKLVHREYHFAETRKGELLWVYYDRDRRRWFLHGRVE